MLVQRLQCYGCLTLYSASEVSAWSCTEMQYVATNADIFVCATQNTVGRVGVVEESTETKKVSTGDLFFWMLDLYGIRSQRYAVFDI